MTLIIKQCVLKFDHHCPCTCLLLMLRVLHTHSFDCGRDRTVCRCQEPQGTFHIFISVLLAQLEMIPVFPHFLRVSGCVRAVFARNPYWVQRVSVDIYI